MDPETDASAYDPYTMTRLREGLGKPGHPVERRWISKWKQSLAYYRLGIEWA
jgi:hypothetical protein